MKRFQFWFTVLSIQLILAAALPTAVLMVLPARDTSVSLEMPGLTLKQLSAQDAIKQAEAFYKSIVSEGAIVFEEQGQQFQVPYSSIWVQFDTTAIRKALEKSQYQNRFFEMIGKPSPGYGQIMVRPYINEALFREKFSPLQELCRTEAADARLDLQQSAVSVIPHQPGLEFDVQKALSYVTEQLQADPTRDIILSKDVTPSLFTATDPAITTQMLQSFSQIYGLTQGTIPDGKTEAFKNLILPFENRMLYAGDSFSFRKSISSFSDTDPLQQLLASIIYQTILPVEELRVLDRKASNQPVSGIEPGLEVSFENDGDLQFKNTADNSLMLVIQAEQAGTWSAALVGKPGLRTGAVRTETTKIQPSVIYSQVNTLPKDSTEVVEPGKEGLSVRVYRVTEGESAMLYEDVYQPIHKIIAVGTGIKKESTIFK